MQARLHHASCASASDVDVVRILPCPDPPSRRTRTMPGLNRNSDRPTRRKVQGQLGFVGAVANSNDPTGEILPGDRSSHASHPAHSFAAVGVGPREVGARERLVGHQLMERGSWRKDREAVMNHEGKRVHRLTPEHVL
jgi:hypothetical protein